MAERGLFARLRFSRQILLLQVGVVVLLLVVGLALVAALLRSTLTDDYGQRALAIARSVAADPDVVVNVEAKRAGGALQSRALAVRARTDTSFVVITDDQGIRLAHPDPAQIGQPVSTDYRVPIGGGEVASAVEKGTLGLSVRSKTYVKTPDGRVVGEVSVGFETDDPTAEFQHLLLIAGGFGGLALLLGVGASALLTRRLRRQTHGLEPHELTELLYEREAVLHGIGEGVVAVDARNRITVCNSEAGRLLGIALPIGADLSELDISPRLRSALADGDEATNLLAVAGERVLVINSRPVRHDDRELGTVLTLRDRTDFETLTRELDAVRSLTDGLRAQRHEYRNRLHTLSGLLQLGHREEAVEYLQTLTDSVSSAAGPVGETVADPYLQALLVAKTEQAVEKGVALRVSDDSWVPAATTDPIALNTVVGNLLDNALHAARMGDRRPATVEIALLAQGNELHVSVVDSGGGIPAELRDTLFTEGVTTKLAPGHGLGLALARQAARARGGDLWLGDPGGENSGALFVAALPGIVDDRTDGEDLP
ncbi:sensor histidine kinase [Amycolatopsis sp. CA-230715]|uniref:sensor histidine kinase n=1 Tax=Amycolatopsis sp. CA-230715 TaxID=2745196 RepID=UPI001C33FFDC|nr:sensor histidine kinase [Amycolatopsis sp. CA-230715]QWF80111.1 Sensor histidine kinase DcuS [Amycolatopsis sp. CA-230715]